MRWDRSRRAPRRAGREPEQASAAGALASAAPARAGSICIASGKGGTGKSVVAASLSALCAARARTLLVDADFGVGNAHILQDVTPEHSFVEVADGRREVRDARTRCRPNLDLVAGGSGVSGLASLGSYELSLIASGLEEVELEYGYVVVDSAAGISSQTISLAAASDVVLLVTTPDVTALTDAYAFLKVLLQRHGGCTPLFVVNRAFDRAEAEHVAERMIGVAHKFLGREPRYLGWLPEDRAVVRSVNERRPVVESEPLSDFARRLGGLGGEILTELERVEPRGLGRSLLRTVGYTPKRA
jgi:flagellar biosynthesis protein FlhG